MIAVWLATTAAVLALPRPKAAGVRLHAIVVLRGPAASTRAAAVAERWRQPFARLARVVTKRPHRAAVTAGSVVAVASFGTGLRLPVAMAAGLVIAVWADTATAVVGARWVRRDDAALAQALSVLEAELVAGAREDVALRAAATVSGRHHLLLREAAASTGYGAETADVLADHRCCGRCPRPGGSDMPAARHCPRWWRRSLATWTCGGSGRWR